MKKEIKVGIIEVGCGALAVRDTKECVQTSKMMAVIIENKNGFRNFLESAEKNKKGKMQECTKKENERNQMTMIDDDGRKGNIQLHCDIGHITIQASSPPSLALTLISPVLFPISPNHSFAL